MLSVTVAHTSLETMDNYTDILDLYPETAASSGLNSTSCSFSCSLLDMRHWTCRDRAL